MECDGYPYPLVPKINSQNEYNFYLPYETSDGKYSGKLACSMYYHPKSASTAASSVTTIPKPPVDLDTNIPFVIVCHGYASWRNQMLLSFLSGGLHTTGWPLPVDALLCRSHRFGDAYWSGTLG